MTTYKPLVLIAGLDQQLDSADALEVSTIDTATLNLTGNLTANSLSLSDYITGYGGSPSDGDVLTWVTANSRYEAVTPAAVISDHGALSGLSDDDHTQYVLADGTRTITGNQTINGTVTANGVTSTGNLSLVGTPSINMTGNVTITDTLSVSAGITSLSPVLTINAGGTVAIEDNLIVSGTIRGTTINATANLDVGGHLTTYGGGTPTNNDVLTWVTANSRAEFKTPTGGSGSAGASITSNTTYYVATTGNDTTGDGTANSPWLTVSKAYEALADEVIADDVEVTIQLANGTYNYTSTVEVHHPQSSRITVKGGDTYDITMNTFVSLSGTQPHRSMVLTVSDTANCSVGDTVIIRDTAVATRNVLLRGATQITSINSSNSTITCNLWKGWTTYDPTTGALTANLTVLKTNMSFNGCDGFLVEDGGHLKIQDIGFDGVDLGYTCLLARGTGSIETTSNNVAGYRFTNGVLSLYGGNVKCEYSAWSYCDRGIYAGYNGEIHADNTLINGCTAANYNINHGGYIDAGSSHSCGCAGSGLVNVGGYFYGDTFRSYANAGNGALIQQGGVGFLNASTIAWCGARGLLCQYGTYCEMANCNVKSNTDTGVFFYGQAGGRITSGTVQHNGNGGVYVGNNSCCQTGGSTVSLNTSWQTSPAALNTLGNNFSFFYS